MVKPQNIVVTRNDRLRSGQYSEVRVIAFGMAPPSPRPVTKRSAVSVSIDVAKAEARLATPKNRVEKTRTPLRPTLSARGPHQGAHHEAEQACPEQRRELRG